MATPHIYKPSQAYMHYYQNNQMYNSTDYKNLTKRQPVKESNLNFISG